ncbi:MAG TPA: YSC84-related protein [Thermoanaerobaculia bacterium]|nr:YSC84-related protein [Thermoanaerobaculia bacterium]HQR66366.1 YSC84-related protein [Thermoanaerobaculia bacterium]
MKNLHRFELRIIRRMLAGSVIGLLAAGLAGAPALGAMSEKEKQKERAEVRKMATETLNKLYKVQPKAKQAVAKSAGYAVFSNFGMKILVAGSGKGQGLAVNTKSKAETFMKMFEVQAGLGIGVKKFRVVFVFESEGALNSFINSGWEAGGEATAAAKAGDKGGDLAGALSVSPGVWMYQLTDKGLAAELAVKGTKYSKDSDLN